MQSLIAIDDFIEHQAGRHIIKLTWTNHGVYTVTVHDSIRQVDDLGGSYADETEARLIARGYAQMFNAEAREAEKPATLDAYRQLHRATPTRSQVHRKPLTEAEKSLIAAHVDGVVKVRPGQPWTMLRSIHQRIGGQVTYQPGTRKYASLTLSAEQLGEVA